MAGLLVRWFQDLAMEDGDAYTYVRVNVDSRSDASSISAYAPAPFFLRVRSSGKPILVDSAARTIACSWNRADRGARSARMSFFTTRHTM